MNAAEFHQVDVFARTPGGGNPLGVVLGAADWSTARMLAFARWTNLVETTFVLPPDDPQADYRLRIFTPQREIAYAGHPTVGSAHVVLAQRGGSATRKLVQSCAAGLLPLQVCDHDGQQEIAVRAPRATLEQQHAEAPEQLRAALQDRRLGSMGVARVEGGRRWWLAELDDVAQVRQWQPDHTAIAALARTDDALGLCVFARDPGAHIAELVVRAFPAGVGITEDPASGAANGLIAAWIAAHPAHADLHAGYRVSQGREMGKDALLRIGFDTEGGIWVGGRCHTMIRGTLDFPEPE